MPFLLTYLLLKNDSGEWIKTHFFGEEKPDAEIITEPIDAQDIITDLSSPLVKSTEAQVGLFAAAPFFSLILAVPLAMFASKEQYVSGVQYVAFKGDFSDSITRAEQYDDSDYGGYNLITNNCLHYAKDILREGTAENAEIDKYIHQSIEIVPKNFYYGLEDKLN